MVERRAYSMDEVAKHNTEEDCWLVVHDLVLKLPKDFLDEHPGGPEVVVASSGKDASGDFEDIAHTDSAREWASKFIIGYKEGAETSADDPIEKRKLKSASEGSAGGSGGGSSLNFVVPILIAIMGGVCALYLRR
eukprot:TRINITY_DN562_c0_g1_i13.p1 TRINITY_DN562_c0_g1~~TRINITY_DN562_c0_g1_i13.p1  ORF type:complete len:135 (-),score=28.39 TRINITY_DN562_c0_g1_i13:35-439(-)